MRAYIAIHNFYNTLQFTVFIKTVILDLEVSVDELCHPSRMPFPSHYLS